MNGHGLDSVSYGLHSFRSGTATMSANSKSSDRLWNKHCRWRNDLATDGYVEDSLNDRLSISLNLHL